MRILLVEDDPDLSRQLKLALADAGYAVDHAPDGEEAQFLGETEPYDAVILDLGLPKVDGVSVLERWRRENMATPVLILTARGAWSEKVAGFDAGADDYLTKPFHLDELFARIRALIRRGPVVRPIVLTVGDLRVDTAAHRCWRGDTEIVLTSKEYALLEMFARQPGTVLTREVLMEHCWDFAYESRSNVVDVHIRALRDKIDRPFGLASVETVRGAGYRLRADGNRNESSTP
jgi:two-component system OmpR family response regulator